MEYYVYAHVRLDTNTIFYVGKSKKKRAQLSGSYRNNRWNNIVKRFGYKIEYLETGLTEEQAFNFEKLHIERLKKQGQCEANYALGGEGISGYKFTESQRNNLSNIQKSNSLKIVNGHKKQAEKLKGRTKNTHAGLKIISIKNSGIGNGRAIYNIITPDGTFDTIKSTANFYKISTTAVHKRLLSSSFNWKKVLKGDT